MTESGEMEVILVGGCEQDTPILSKEGELDSPICRRSERRRSSRAFSARGRLAKARPKSLLMRMVEMRKGGLRGRDLRLSGLKGGSAAKASKGLMGSAGGGLVAIPEGIDVLEEGVGGEGSAGGVSGKKELDVAGLSELGDRVMEKALLENGPVSGAVVLPQGVYLEGGRVLAIEDIPDDSMKKIECDNAPLLVTNESALMLAEMDIMLDLSEVQPLKNMSFLIPREGPDAGSSLTKFENGVEGGKWAEVREINIHDKIMREKLSSEGVTDDGRPSMQKQCVWSLGEVTINKDFHL